MHAVWLATVPWSRFCFHPSGVKSSAELGHVILSSHSQLTVGRYSVWSPAAAGLASLFKPSVVDTAHGGIAMMLGMLRLGVRSNAISIIIIIILSIIPGQYLYCCRRRRNNTCESSLAYLTDFFRKLKTYLFDQSFPDILL